MRRQEIDRKRELRDAISGRKKEKAPKKEKQKEIDADLNDDGVVDEEDLNLAREAVEAAKKAKKIVKRKGE